MNTEPLATISDVEGAFRPLVGDESGQAAHLLVLASALVRGEFPRTDERLGTGDLDRDVVAHLVAGIVVRGLRNPDAARSRSETVGPFTTSATYADAVAQLSLLPAERRLLSVPSGLPPGLGTIRLTPGLAPPPGSRDHRRPRPWTRY